jgi:hypothetical protein
MATISLILFAVALAYAYWLKHRRQVAGALQAQIAEDTCEEHDLYLCEECFDLEPA